MDAMATSAAGEWTRSSARSPAARVLQVWEKEEERVERCGDQQPAVLEHHLHPPAE